MIRAPAEGKLSQNVMHFAQTLRRAGVAVGPDRVLDSLRALEVTGVARREDFYWTLASVFLSRREQFELFDQAFQLFWSDRLLPESASAALPLAAPSMGPDREAPPGRLADALGLTRRARLERESPRSADEPDSAPGASQIEALRRRDFETMTADELIQAKRLIAGLRLPIPDIGTRRLEPDSRGRFVDLRGTLRASLRGNADVILLRRRSHQHRHPPLVILCDISGSMSRYSRMFLHFMHAITNDRDRVHTFVFGTRLTNITRHLRHRDVDRALGAVSLAVADWSGGTRIGATLKEFNLCWSRRVLGQNAEVLLISDGLDRDDGLDLPQAMERLHKSCRKLIWLNPLLRFDGFEPKATGVGLMLPHVDAFVPAHSVESLADLARFLAPAQQDQRRQ
jgi:uncharacterized protein with von Willebrand factor type A (vWA) domain